ncbi:MAG: acyl-ACP--UDP-N-acetylglucosamine O-acyltransferase [bacterium]|nr:acyl-ACP--UDP-N-acetylglucosamine O-acyltransferase [bacterium]
MNIHKTAIINPKAELADDVEVGAYVIIEENVKIGKGTKIGAHTYITGWTEIGENCQIHMGVILGNEPQVAGYKGERSYVLIGDNNIIREYVTIHRAMEEDGVTKIGNDNFIMANVHIAHNCIIGNNVTITNFAGLTGHIEVEDDAVISGLVAIHQFVKIGRLSMIGGASKVTQDVPPYILVDGHPARAYGLNLVGLKRIGISDSIRSDLQKAYRLLYRSSLNITDALKKIEEELPPSDEVKHLVEFIRNSKRGICREKDLRLKATDYTD